MIFDKVEDALKAEGEQLVKKMKGIFGFKVRDSKSGQTFTWIVDAKNGSGKVEFEGKGTYIGENSLCQNPGWGICQNPAWEIVRQIALLLTDRDIFFRRLKYRAFLSSDIFSVPSSFATLPGDIANRQVCCMHECWCMCTQHRWAMVARVGCL